MSILQEIDNIVNSNKVVLFMKGTATQPMCGFSSIVVSALQRVKCDFVDINVLDSDEMRSGIKEYRGWPTIPQLYVKGELIGGCDIVKELYESGELSKIVAS